MSSRGFRGTGVTSIAPTEMTYPAIVEIEPLLQLESAVIFAEFRNSRAGSNSTAISIE